MTYDALGKLSVDETWTAWVTWLGSLPLTARQVEIVEAVRANQKGTNGT